MEMRCYRRPCLQYLLQKSNKRVDSQAGHRGFSQGMDILVSFPLNAKSSLPRNTFCGSFVDWLTTCLFVGLGCTKYTMQSCRLHCNTILLQCRPHRHTGVEVSGWGDCIKMRSDFRTANTHCTGDRCSPLCHNTALTVSQNSSWTHWLFTKCNFLS